MICIVIPTLNSKADLERVLGQVDTNTRIVVSDGGSEDRTLDVATANNAVIAIGTSGRGMQLRRGVTWALEAPWIFVLHADSTLPKNFFDTVIRHTNEHPDKAAYFNLRFDSLRLSARIIECVVKLRCQLFGLPYGDQGLLISRRLYDEIGGYENIPLFEDVALVKKIGKDRLRCLGGPLITSPARFETEGYFRRGWRNYKLLRRYLRGESPEMLAKDYSCSVRS